MVVTAYHDKTQQSCQCTIPVARPQIQLEQKSNRSMLNHGASWAPTLFGGCYVGLGGCNPVKQWGSPCRPRAKIDSYPKHVQKSGPLVLSRLWSPKIASIKQPKRHVFCFLRGPIFQLQTPESPHRIWESCGATGVISFVESSLDDEMMTRWPGLRKMLGENFDTIFFYWIVVFSFFSTSVSDILRDNCRVTVVLYDVS